MDFLTITFAVFFIISVICYYAVPKKFRWGVLLISSMIFYMWSVPYLVIYLLFSAVTTFAFPSHLSAGHRIFHPICL